MARTLFYIEAALFLLGSVFLASAASIELWALLAPALVCLLVPLACASSVWPLREVLGALLEAFRSTPNDGQRCQASMVLKALGGLMGPAAALGVIGGAISLLTAASMGSKPLSLLTQSLAYGLFGILYGSLVAILREAVRDRATTPTVPGIAGSPRAGVVRGLLALSAEAGLSPRESEVASLLLEGLRYKEIGDVLFISIKTVKSHVSRIYGKCGVSTRAALIGRILQMADGAGEPLCRH